MENHLSESEGFKTYKCPITQELPLDPVKLPTTPHYFDRVPIVTYIGMVQKNPLTREATYFKDIVSHPSIDNYLEFLKRCAKQLTELEESALEET